MANKSAPGQDKVRYEVITQEDNEGDLMIPIPLPLLQRLGWQEGMEVELGVNANGQIFLKRPNK